MNVSYREKVVVFGSERSLVGVLTMSTVTTSNPASPFVVIPNSGLVHRVGPNRLSVRLAREFAGLGLTTLRFDLSGIGDSAPPRDTISLEESVIRDMDQALSYLQDTHGAERFILAGLCSGAYDSFRVAYRDSRVDGVVLLDYHAYKTAGFYLRHYKSRLMRIESWQNAFSGENRYLSKIRTFLINKMSRQVSSEKSEEHSEEMPRWPTQEQFGVGLEKILARNTRLMFVYTGGKIDSYNYKDQFFELFPEAAKSELVRIEFFPEVDHTFSSEDYRQLLFEMIENWMTGARLIDKLKSN